MAIPAGKSILFRAEPHQAQRDCQNGKEATIRYGRAIFADRSCIPCATRFAPPRFRHYAVSLLKIA